MAWLDNVTWPKVALVLGGIILTVAARVLFPEEAQWLVDSIKDIAGVIFQFFANLGGTE